MTQIGQDHEVPSTGNRLQTGTRQRCYAPARTPALCGKDHLNGVGRLNEYRLSFSRAAATPVQVPGELKLGLKSKSLQMA